MVKVLLDAKADIDARDNVALLYYLVVIARCFRGRACGVGRLWSGYMLTSVGFCKGVTIW